MLLASFQSLQSIFHLYECMFDTRNIEALRLVDSLPIISHL